MQVRDRADDNSLLSEEKKNKNGSHTFSFFALRFVFFCVGYVLFNFLFSFETKSYIDFFF